MPTRTLGPEGRWTPGGVPARTLGPEDGWIVRSHIDWRERVPNEEAGPEREWIVRSHLGWRGNKEFLMRGWKPLPIRRVLKTLIGSWETRWPRRGVDCEIPPWLERGTKSS